MAKSPKSYSSKSGKSQKADKSKAEKPAMAASKNPFAKAGRKK